MQKQLKGLANRVYRHLARTPIFYEIRSFSTYRKRISKLTGPARRNVLSSANRKRALRNWGYTGYLNVVAYSSLENRNCIDYIPFNFYKWKFIPKYNLKTYSVVGNKGYLDYYFPGASPTLVSKREGNWYLREEVVSESAAWNFIGTNIGNGLVFKSGDGMQGKSVYIFEDFRSENYKYMREKADNFKTLCVQTFIRQHQSLGRYHRSSLNSIRILTFCDNNQVRYISALVRFGVSGSVVDNRHQGGIGVIIRDDGTAHETAMGRNFCRYGYHPTSKLEFKDLVVPEFERIISTAKSLHSKVPYLGMVGWDFAVDQTNKIWLLESNVKAPETGVHQIYNGPIFRDELLTTVYKMVTGREFQR